MSRSFSKRTRLALAATSALVLVGSFVVLRKPSPPVELERTNLVVKERHLYAKDAAVPFSGVMVEHYPSGALQSRSEVRAGLLDGVSRGFYTNGTVQVEEHFRAGVSHGLRQKWYEDGGRMSEATIQDGKVAGTFRRWHPNGVLAEELTMVDGRPDGIARAYYPSGCLKAEVKHEAGKVVLSQKWEDGQKRLSGDKESLAAK